MYATRQRVVGDENPQMEGKGVAAGRGGRGQRSNRRAFGDIGNLVDDLSVRCNVSKSMKHESQGAAQPNNFGGYLQQQQQQAAAVAEAGGICAWGSKQKRSCKISSNADALTREITNPTSGSTHPTSGSTHNFANPSTRKQEITHTSLLSTVLSTGSSDEADGVESDLEMQEAEEEALHDIDKADAGNHLAVVDYVQELYCFYRTCESSVSQDYMSRQADINEKMRAILIDWLIEVHLKFKLMPETLYLTINLIDRYLSAESVSRRHLQLVGVTAMLLAAKYEEIWAPEVQDFVVISDGAYTRDQVLAMERKMLNTLSFNLTVPTPYVFIVRFLKAASADRQLILLAFFLLELCLVEYSMVNFPPSVLAAAAVYTAQSTLNQIPSWSCTMQIHTGYAEAHLKKCAGMIVGFHHKAAEGNLTVVYRKFAVSKFSSVSMLQPARCLQEQQN